MKKSNDLSSLLARRRGLVCLSLAGLGLGLLPLSLSAADNSEPKNYTLFVGVDLAVEQNGNYLPIVGANPTSLDVQSGKTVTQFPLQQAKSIRVTRGVKLSSLNASVSNLRFEKVNDATSKDEWAASVHGNLALQEQASAKTYNANFKAQAETVVYGASAALGGVGGASGARNSQVEGAFESATESMRSIRTLRDGLMNQQHTLSDTIGFSCTVQAPRPLENAYLVVVADYVPAGHKGEAPSHRVSTKNITKVDQKARIVQFEVSGFPAESEIVDAHLSLFANGQEIATNLSEKQVPLTREEARDYVFIEYLTAHKGETRPPALVAMKTKTEMRSGIDVNQLPQVVYAKIDDKGQINNLSMDESGRQPASENVQAFVSNFSFIPALDKGVPVSGRLTMRPAELVQ